jgi:hypothetical protein
MVEHNMGEKPIADIPSDILACLRRIEDRGTIEAARCKSAGKSFATK